MRLPQTWRTDRNEQEGEGEGKHSRQRKSMCEAEARQSTGSLEKGKAGHVAGAAAHGRCHEARGRQGPRPAGLGALPRQWGSRRRESSGGAGLL